MTRAETLAKMRALLAEHPDPTPAKLEAAVARVLAHARENREAKRAQRAALVRRLDAVQR